MESINKNLFGYIILNIGENKFDKLGCEHLIKAQWPQLTELYLGTPILTSGKSNIDDEACEVLARGQWKKLSDLYLLDNKIGMIGC